MTPAQRSDRKAERIPALNRLGSSQAAIRTIAGPQVAVQPMLLRMLEQAAAGAVHDALRLAGSDQQGEITHSKWYSRSGAVS